MNTTFWPDSRVMSRVGQGHSVLRLRTIWIASARFSAKYSNPSTGLKTPAAQQSKSGIT